MRKLLPFLLYMVCHVSLAQQDPIYSQYLLNPLVINPAYAGINNNFNIMVGYRTEWTGLEGQPQTFYASGHSSIVNNKAGVGLLLMNDRIGSTSTTEAMASFSYKIELTKSTISYGMQAGLQSFRNDYGKLNLYDADDFAFLGNETFSRLNLGAGAILKSETFMIGFSVPRILPSKFSNAGQEFELYSRHYYLMGGYTYYLNESVRLKPSVLVRDVKGSPASIDLAFNINLNAIHTAGIFSRNFHTYGLLLQTLAREKYRFGYVFEMPTNKSVGPLYTSHEISLGILFSAFSFHQQSLNNF